MSYYDPKNNAPYQQPYTTGYPPQQQPQQAYPPQTYPPQQPYYGQQQQPYPPQQAPGPYNMSYQPAPQPYQQPPPQTAYEPYKPNDNKFPEGPSYRDPFWTLLFIANCIAIVVLFITGTKRYSDDPNAENVYIDVKSKQFREFTSVIMICAAVAFAFGILYLQFAKRYARQLIIGTAIASVALWAAWAIILFALGSVVSAIFMLLWTVLMCFFFYSWRARIPFATAVLETVASILELYPASTYIAYLSIIVQGVAVSVILWTACVNQYFSTGSTYLLMVFFIFSIYWTAQVIKNVVHVSTAGTVATWYFLQQQMPTNPTLKSFKRATTTSFGSICLGSLLVAALQTLRALVRGARNQRNGILVCIADCILGCIENLIRYFNLYAFTQVAIYGKSYCEAARDTWSLVHSHGIEAIINDNLISNVLSIGSLLGGVVCAIVGGLVGAAIAPDYWGACAGIGFVIGLVMLIVIMEVIESAVACIFVCFAMDREALRRNNPALFQRFMETYGLV